MLSGLIKNNPTHYLGHNPAGGIMVIIMLVSLLTTAFAELKTIGSEGRGPLADNGKKTGKILGFTNHCTADSGSRRAGTLSLRIVYILEGFQEVLHSRKRWGHIADRLPGIASNPRPRLL